MSNILTSSQCDFLHGLFHDLCKITNAIALVQESSHVDDLAADSLIIIIRDLCTQNESLFETFGSDWSENK